MSQLISILLLSLLQLLVGTDTLSIYNPHLAEADSVDLLFAGDAMQHAPQNKAALQRNGTYDYTACFALLEPYIKAADYAVVNLETPLGGRPYTGYPCFSAPDEYAWQLKKSGFDLLLTANNHCLDRRDAGLRRTIKTLDAMKIAHIGTYTDAADRRSRLPFIVDIKGMKVAFLDYTYGTNGITVQGDVVVDYIELHKMQADIEAARAAGAQAVCVNMHWGIEYKLAPSSEQRSLAQWLVDHGVELVIGGHPHVLEPFKMVHSSVTGKDALVVYSMGNFISAQKPLDTRLGAMVRVTLKTGTDGKISIARAGYKLFYCQHPGWKGDNYRLIPDDRREMVRKSDRAAYDAAMARARNLVMAHNVQVLPFKQ